MTTTVASNPGLTQDQLKGLISGFTASPPPNLSSITIHGTNYTFPALIAQLNVYAGAYANVDTTAAAHVTAVQARNAIEAQAIELVQGATGSLKSIFGKQSTALQAYDVKPDKAPTPLTPEQKVAKNAQAKATRAARHTMGPKQKKAVKGVVPSAGAPPAETPAAAPAALTPPAK